MKKDGVMITNSQNPWETNKKDEEEWSNNYKESVSHQKQIRKMKKDVVMITNSQNPWETNIKDEEGWSNDYKQSKPMSNK